MGPGPAAIALRSCHNAERCTDSPGRKPKIELHLIRGYLEFAGHTIVDIAG
ncbi:hypothetical protein SAMN05661093_05282 [Kibdelosporangium aridum]|uniref:Uncharacterized protein n=1 Tax=Kibdelosporangium aridum TaxID=2030 RepID=A0A1W2F1Y7_KIBAR|nr:hypothetical protein SAMN05661093_05282 [Kibdelosporangium aridum]